MWKNIRYIFFIPIGFLTLTLADTLNSHIYEYLYTFHGFWRFVLFFIVILIQSFSLLLAIAIPLFISPAPKFAAWFFGIFYISGYLYHIYNAAMGVSPKGMVILCSVNILVYLFTAPKVVREIKNPNNYPPEPKANKEFVIDDELRAAIDDIDNAMQKDHIDNP